MMGAHRSNFVLVGLGEVLWDLLPGGRQLGGAPANFAYHARALGSRGIVVSCVGDDYLGREILHRFGELGLECGYIAIDREHPTGTVTVELDAAGKPDYIIHEGVAWDFIPFNPDLQALAGRADAVCFGSLCQRSAVSRETIRRFLEATREDCLRVFDINLRQSYFNADTIHAMLDLSNVLKLNDEELPVVAELLEMEGSESDLLARLIDRYSLYLIALTRAARGSRLARAGKESTHPGYAVKVADTVGAGDSFAAALAVGLLRGESLDRINKRANLLAGYVCTRSGAMPELPAELLTDE